MKTTNTSLNAGILRWFCSTNHKGVGVLFLMLRKWSFGIIKIIPVLFSIYVAIFVDVEFAIRPKIGLIEDNPIVGAFLPFFLTLFSILLLMLPVSKVVNVVLKTVEKVLFGTIWYQIMYICFLGEEFYGIFQRLYSKEELFLVASELFSEKDEEFLNTKVFKDLLVSHCHNPSSTKGLFVEEVLDTYSNYVAPLDNGTGSWKVYLIALCICGLLVCGTLGYLFFRLSVLEEMVKGSIPKDSGQVAREVFVALEKRARSLDNPLLDKEDMVRLITKMDQDRRLLGAFLIKLSEINPSLFKEIIKGINEKAEMRKNFLFDLFGF